MLNPASMKQALVEGAEKLKDYNMFEQVRRTPGRQAGPSPSLPPSPPARPARIPRQQGCSQLKDSASRLQVLALPSPLPP
jgi:hypothetical protein